MGIAIASGIIESLDATKRSISNGFPKWEVHTPGTLTPSGTPDPSTPSRFFACVKRESTAQRLVKVFASSGGPETKVVVYASKNVQAVSQSDVVLLWYVFDGCWRYLQPFNQKILVANLN